MKNPAQDKTLGCNDITKIDKAMKRLKSYFKTGKTKDVAWRKAQINALKKGTDEMRNEIMAAIKSDLGRHEFLSEIAEVSGIIGNCDWNLKNIDRMMADEHVETEMLQYSTCKAKTIIRYEPLGVVAVYGAWNYPYNLTVDPMLQAIVTGNCCILKPSEHSPATSAVIKTLCERYMD